MSIDNDAKRRELEEEYISWATICLDKHGLPWPISEDKLKDATQSELAREVKKLKELGRTPHN